MFSNMPHISDEYHQTAQDIEKAKRVSPLIEYKEAAKTTEKKFDLHHEGLLGSLIQQLHRTLN